MTTTDQQARAVTDPVGLITDLITRVEKDLDPAAVRAVVLSVAGGRAKSRRLAEALAARPEVLSDGRSPAPRAIGDLLIALRKAGATTISPPICRDCGKHLRTFQRRGQDWYCGVCNQDTAECAGCGTARRIHSRDRAGRPRCSMCPDTDPRDPVDVIHEVITGISPAADREVVADAVRRSAPRPSYQQKLAWALEEDPRLLTGKGHLAPLRAIPRLIDLLHAADVAGVVRPACPCCQRVIRIDKPLDGQRVCRNCIAKSRIEKCSRCGARREPATRDAQGRPLCPHCLITDPANLENCILCGCPRTRLGAPPSTELSAPPLRPRWRPAR